MRSLARRSGPLSDPAGWALAFACWTLLLAGCPSEPQQSAETAVAAPCTDTAGVPAFGPMSDGGAAFLGFNFDQASPCKHETIVACAVGGCDPATCQQTRCFACGAPWRDARWAAEATIAGASSAIFDGGGLSVTLGADSPRATPWCWARVGDEVLILDRADMRCLARGTEIGQDVDGHLVLRDSQGRLQWRSPETVPGVWWAGVR